MLLSIKANNCLIYNTEVEFSMRANMHYKRFPGNVSTSNGVNALKTAVLIGPNNSGKSILMRLIETIKDIMLGTGATLRKNLFSDDPIAEARISFWESDAEYLFEIKYDTVKHEYVFEHFARIERDQYKNVKVIDLLVRDIRDNRYYAEDDGLDIAMKTASKNNILIHLVNTEVFPRLQKIKDIITAFATKIDVVDMNNIPIQKTIDMLKSSDETRQKVANFVLKADLCLEDYRYVNNDDLRDALQKTDAGTIMPQENALAVAAPLDEMLHLVSVYNGVPVSGMLYDSTGTKKIAALASYVIDALEHGRILIVDELDNSLHFRITRAIIAMFNNELNQNAQLIATVHDVSLLDCQTLFRKEQIWFTHKDHENAYLYSLSEFTTGKTGVRDSSDLIEKYKKGTFGALPEPDFFQSLLGMKKDGLSGE